MEIERDLPRLLCEAGVATEDQARRLADLLAHHLAADLPLQFKTDLERDTQLIREDIRI